MRALVEHFARLEDPRVERSQRHTLVSVVTIALCGVICGAESWVEIEQFAQAKAQWFASFLGSPGWTPSSLRPALQNGCGRWPPCCRPR